MGQEDRQVISSQAGVAESVEWEMEDPEDLTLPRPYTVSDCIAVKDLAVELGVNRTTLRRYVQRENFDIVWIRRPDTNWQLTMALTPDEAQRVRTLRSEQGFTGQIVRKE